MSLNNSLKRIKQFVLERYGNNLAAILIFGSANTGHFVEGKSDIDTIILLKRKCKLNFKNEIRYLFEIDELQSEKLKILHFKTIKNYEKHIYNEGSWSSWVTVIEGSKKIYSTSYFEKFKERLIKKPISRKKLFEYLKQKDKFELKGYFKKTGGFDLTKALMSHLRRKLQIMNYFKTGKIIFDYNACLRNVDLDKSEKVKLTRLYKLYKKRKKLSNEEIKHYKKIAEEFTKRIIQMSHPSLNS